MTGQHGALSERPRVIVACLCADFHAAGGGGFNIIRIYDSLAIGRPEGLPPGVAVPVTVQAVTCWTEGLGQHLHQLRALDEDGNPVYTAPEVSFMLPDFSLRHWILDRVVLQVIRSTNYTIEISLDGDSQAGLRYVFPVTLT